MKKVFKILAIMLTVVSLSAYGQQYVPREQSVTFGKTTAHAWVIAVGDEPLDVLKKSWTRYVKQELDVKAKKDGRDALVTREVLLPTIYAHQGDLRVKFSTEGGQSSIAVAFVLGYDNSLNSQEYPEATKKLQRLAKNFVKYHKTDRYTHQIAQSEQRERAIESAYKKNERERKQLVKRIAKIDKQVVSPKTEAAEKFDLKNQRVAHASRVTALEKIMLNQKHELSQVNRQIQQLRADITYLEHLFTEAIAEQ